MNPTTTKGARMSAVEMLQNALDHELREQQKARMAVRIAYLSGRRITPELRVVTRRTFGIMRHRIARFRADLERRSQ